MGTNQETEFTDEELMDLISEEGIRLLKQLLNSKFPSVTARELSYQNGDLEIMTIISTLNDYSDAGLVEKLEKEDTPSQVPNQFWELTQRGEAFLKEVNAYDEREPWDYYDNLKDSLRMSKIVEYTDRPTSSKF